MNQGRAAFVPECKDLNTTRRSVTHLISTDTRDRVGDVIDPRGWELDNYRKNPVVLVDHDYRVEKIIGRGEVESGKDGLFSTTVFAATGLGAAAWELVQAGFARSWSVGFKPIEYEPLKDKKGYRYTKQELLEYSLVAIPMNPDAVLTAVRRGLSADDMATLFAPSTGPAESARCGANASGRWKQVTRTESWWRDTVRGEWFKTIAEVLKHE